MKRLTVLAVLCMAGAASADTIRLKNGGTLEGVILKEGDGAVVVRLTSATVTLDKTDIEGIDRAKAEPAPAAGSVRLVRWDKCIEVVAKRTFMIALAPIDCASAIIRSTASSRASCISSV